MSEQNDFFSPQHVDESIHLLSSPEQAGNMLPWQIRMQPDARLVHDLQDTYNLERESYLRALQRVEDRLVAQRLTGSQPGPAPVPVAPHSQPFQAQTSKRKGLQSMEYIQPVPSSSFGRRIRLLVATLFTVVLVGSLSLVLTVVHQRASAPGGGVSLPPSTGTLGKTLYTLSGTQGFNSLAFSPDSQRVAAAETDGSVHIWDATTGQHLVTVAMPYVGFQVAWSPNGKLLAIVTDGGLEIANGQSGALIHSSSYPGFGLLSGGGSALAQHLQSSGGFGVAGLAWSPDGRFIAVSLSTGGANGYIQVLNAQTYAPVYQLPVDSSYGTPGLLAWSADGKYLATGALNIDTLQSETLAWNMANRQIVFAKATGNGSVTSGSQSIANPLAFHSGGPSFSGGDSLAFQPGTDNLTLTPLSSSAIEVWSLVTGKQLANYRQAGNGTMVWSPGGRYIASVDATVTNQVDILDTFSGKKVYTYTMAGAPQIITALDWSPNGKYIASGETGSVSVWSAE